jgi:PAS domain S-box-containing protein
MRHKNGEVRHVEIRGTLMMWEGRPALLNFMTDVTERTQAEQALQEAHANLKLTLKAGSAGAWDWDIGSNIFIWSEEFREIFGMDPGTTAGFEAWSKAVHPDDRESASTKIQDAIDKKEDLTNDYRIVLPGGETRWIRAIGKTFYDGSTPVRMTGLCIDITDRKRAEEELRRNAGMNAALAELYEPLTSPGATIENITVVVLKKAMDLTTSAHGYVAEIDPLSADNLVHAITDMFPKRRRALGEDSHLRFPRGGDGRYGGLWGYSLDARKAFFTNRPEEHPAARGVPKGHDRIERFLSVPVLLGSELVGQIALANADRDYSQLDVEAIRRLAEFYALAIQRVRAEQTILHSLSEKEALLREIHHRVKNNLQIVSSLLSMAGMGTKSNEAADMLHDAESRVHAMALIHSQLYGSERLDQIDVKKNIRDLTDRLSSIYDAGARHITHSVAGDDVSLTIHQAVPAALAVNEIVTNAYKYAFNGRESGSVRISVGMAGDMLSISIADDGVGFPDGFNVETTDTLGLRLVTNLIEGQLSGKVDFDQSGGTKVTMSFRMDPHVGTPSS